MTHAATHPPEIEGLAAFKERIETVAHLFGAPAELARTGWIERAVARAARLWIRLLEVMACLLILKLAETLVAPRTRDRGFGVGGGGGGGRRAVLRDGCRRVDASDPDSAHWRGIAFRLPRSAGLRDPVRGATPGAKSSRRPPARLVESLPLAIRFEALCRVAQAPELYAKKYARAAPAPSAPPSRAPKPRPPAPKPPPVFAAHPIPPLPRPPSQAPPPEELSPPRTRRRVSPAWIAGPRPRIRRLDSG
jgi:hypothetical protein